MIAEALRRAGAATTRDHHLRVGERDAASRLPRRARGRGRRGRPRRARAEALDSAPARPTRLRLDARAAAPSGASGAPWIRASSRRLPPQRIRVTTIGSPAVAAMQFAANGRSSHGGEAREHLVAPLVAARNHGGGRRACPTSSASSRDRGRCVAREERLVSATWSVSTPEIGKAAPAVNAETARRVSARMRVPAASRSPASSTETRTRHAAPIRRSTSTTAGAASGPWPRISASLPLLSGTTRRSQLERRLGSRRRARVNGFALRSKLRRH